MNNKIILACVVVFSAIVFGLSSDWTEAESFIPAKENGKCAIAAFKDALAASSAVFVGKVKSEKKVGDTRVFELEVEKYWKGAKKKKIEISVYETARFQAWFEVGEKYLVFASAEDGGALHVGRCSRSKSVVDASEDLQKLGKGKRPK
jgi:hypothetical protein